MRISSKNEKGYKNIGLSNKCRAINKYKSQVKDLYVYIDNNLIGIVKNADYTCYDGVYGDLDRLLISTSCGKSIVVKESKCIKIDRGGNKVVLSSILDTTITTLE